uniref:(California timema) hypothetical protein n=1 Tax=Timema californicum TaxID=61474 RepID=A0A7R9JGC5_TIMCA|nr:unnamed protein product [Timema californicum]
MNGSLMYQAWLTNMECRYIYIFAVILVSFNALESASVLPTHRNWEDDFDKTITKAQAEVDKIKAWIDDQSQQLQTKATASVQDVFTDFDDALKQAQDKGATMGIDVSSCVDGKQETVDSEVQELVQAAFACATNELNSAVDLASNLLDQMETIKNKVVEIAADFEDCNHKNKLKKAECIAKETAKAVEQAAKVEIDVSGFISKETLLFEELAPKLLACEAVQKYIYTHDDTVAKLRDALVQDGLESVDMGCSDELLAGWLSGATGRVRLASNFEPLLGHHVTYWRLSRTTSRQHLSVAVTRIGLERNTKSPPLHLVILSCLLLEGYVISLLDNFPHTLQFFSKVTHVFVGFQHRSDFGETRRDQDNSRTQTIHKRRQPKYLKVLVTGVIRGHYEVSE